ncbi:fatty acid desaturase family protein [uncultured Maricaulis sp.]|uniref:fatty acid desaturase family protein n=1 Tax=uncultured Maricaulis sp. TaxID=174710 RepID=UPI0030D9DABD
MASNLSDCLSREELRELSRPADWQGGLMLAGDFALVILAYGLAILWPNPLTMLTAIALLGGRQLSFAIIMHDCAHRSLFHTRALNEFVGKWIGGAAIDAPFLAYRAYHFDHHKYAGTEKDPDKGLVKDYPVTPASLRRKFTRDLTGQTGMRELIGSWQNPVLAEKLPFLVFQLVMMIALFAAGALWAIALWWAARILIFPAVMRLRHIGEHGVAIDRLDTEPRNNTHTTHANWIERALVAPNYVNYHLEHHLFAAIPPYNLPKLHRVLSERGYFEGYEGSSAPSYRAMLKKAVRTDDAEADAAP